MKTKKLLALTLAAVLTVSSFALSGCSESEAAPEETLTSKIEDKAMAYRTDLMDSMSTLTDNSKVKDYLLNWARSKSVEAKADTNGNVFMTVTGTESYNDAPPTVVVCQYDASAASGISDYIPAMASGLYLAKNATEFGQLTVIFAPENHRDFSGISMASSKYFPDDAQVFCLNPGNKQMWSFNSGSMSSYRFTGDVAYTVPSGDAAYTISIEGLSGGIPDSGISGYPNPIKELGDFLASLKTNAVIFELAGISGGTCAGLYPESATATLVVDSGYVDKLETRLNNAIEKFTEKYGEDHPNMTYTFQQVEMPDRVFTRDTVNDFISTLYTLIDGVYLRDESDNLISITNLGTLSCGDSTWSASAVANSLTQESLADIDMTYETICSLSDIKYEKTGEHAGWFADPESDFAASVAKAFKDYSEADMTFRDCVAATPASYIYEKNPNCSIVNVMMNESKIERYTGTIVTFMANLPHAEETAE